MKLETIRALGERFRDEMPWPVFEELATVLQRDLDQVGAMGEAGGLESADETIEERRW